MFSKEIKVVLAFLSCFACFSEAVANTTDEGLLKGLEIAKIQDDINDGWNSSRVNMKMVLFSRSGESSVRRLRVEAIEMENDGDRTKSVFDEPKDIRGTALLSFSHASIADEQWLYLPALKRVKRINSQNRSGSFMGSEFSYEDIAPAQLEDYDYRFIKTTACGELECYVVERYPRDKHSGYSRLIAWVDTRHYRDMQIEYYDHAAGHIKTLAFSGHEVYKDKFWRPQKGVMTNHKTGKITELYWEGYEFEVGLRQGDFNKNALKRTR